jgi:hypothetical protein
MLGLAITADTCQQIGQNPSQKVDLSRKIQGSDKFTNGKPLDVPVEQPLQRYYYSRPRLGSGIRWHCKVNLRNTNPNP